MTGAALTPEDEAILARLPAGLRAANGVPDPVRATERERAAALAARVTGHVLHPDGVRTSPLGPGWARDLDLHVRTLPGPEDLLAAGWLSLDQVLTRIGSAGNGRWAVVDPDTGRILASADLHRTAPPDPLRSVLGRARRRGEIRLREVLELRVLQRAGEALPGGDPVVAAAARAEASLGGSDLARWLDGPSTLPPIALRASGLRHRLGSRKERLPIVRSPRLVVAVSGVDGAGKSTLTEAVAELLERAGIPVSRVWTRPGMRLKWLEWVARLGKRILRQGDPDEAGVGRVAQGETADALPSRRGVVGFVWSLLVTLAYVRDVRRRHRRTEGVVLYDRHLLDALVTLDFAYEGVNLRLHHGVVRILLPKAALSFYLDVPADVAVARKPGDLFGRHAVERQLEGYAGRQNDISGLEVLDGTRPQEELARTVLLRILGTTTEP